jgi:hypothetical protein
VDAVLSFARGPTLVGDISGVVSSFAMLWAQSPSDYDFLISQSMMTDWVYQHMPVLSRHQTGHILYTKFSLYEPRGMLVLCHRRCKEGVSGRAHGDEVQYECDGCKSRCVTPKLLSSRDTTLGRRALVKTTYPQEQWGTEWKLSQEMRYGLRILQ